MTDYLKDANGKIVRDATGEPIPLSAFENEPSEKMRKIAKRDSERESDREFFLRIGWTEEEIKKAFPNL